MHPSTEDLLSVRDGEPLDAARSNAIADDPALEREIERMRHVRRALSQLPELPPPDDLWQRIVAVEHETRPRSGAWRLALGAGIAAAVAALAIFVMSSPSRPTGGIVPTTRIPAGEDFTTGTSAEPSPSDVGPETLLDPDRPFVDDRVVLTSYPELVQESARLDRVLRRMPHQRPMMSAETATTIAGLEDRIALIDEQITYSNARGVPQPQRVALWGERVDLMNALVHVRYAQAQP
jgi:hypothetical protein